MPTDRAPLSAAQTHCWRHHQLDDGRATTQVAVAARVRGALDLRALRRAVDGCLDCHDALRVSIGVDRGLPYQRVESAIEFVIPVHDLTEAEFPEGLRALTAVPFALDMAPLLRIHVFRFAPEDNVIALVAHRMIADEISLDLLLDDLSGSYAAALEGRSPALPAPAHRHVDLAADERPPDPAATAYLSERLHDLPARHLPLDRPRIRPAGNTARLPFTLPDELAADLTRLARDEDITVATVLQSAFATLLHRITGQREVAFAVPVAGRRRAGSERVVGCFGSEVVLRIGTDPAQDPRALRRAVWETALDADAHQDAVSAVLRQDRVADRDPPYDVLLAVHPTRPPVPNFAGANVERVVVDPGIAKLGLTVELRHDGDALAGHWEYRTDLFDERTVAAWMNAFTELVVLQQDGSVAELAERQRRRAPDRIAVIAGERRLTFEQVGQQAELTAAVLRDRGAGPDQLVGIRLGRTAELPGAVLGVLRSGAGFVPLRDGQRDDTLCTVLDSPVVNGQRVSLRPVHPENLAYALHAPGTAGRAKVVMVTQRSLVHHLLSKATALGIGPGDRVLHRTPLIFDAAVWELLLPLVTGATQVLAEPGREHEPAHLVDLIRTHRVTVLQAVPATLRLLVAHPGFADCTSLRVICSGGAMLDSDLAERLSAVARVYTLYGPAETTVDVAAGRYLPGSGVVGICEVYPGTSVELIDDQLAPVPPGAVGEICVSGVAVGRGYRAQPGLTAQRFVADPATPGARRYRTGDLGRLHPDGTLEYLGRRNRQSKIERVPAEIGHGRVPKDVVARGRGAQLVAGIVSDLLGVGPVGTEDDFFDLGGHSLPAAQLVARVEEATGVRLRLRDVFVLRTPAALGSRIDAADPRPVPGTVTATCTDRYPVSPAQRRILFLDRMQPGTSAYTVASAAWLIGPLSIPVLRTACAELVTRHDTLRTMFRTEPGGDQEAVVLPPADVLTVVEGAATPSADAEALRLLRHWAGRPFDLAGGPLLRVVLVRLGCERYVLGLAVHHIACDGSSVPLLIADLAAAYEDTRGWAKRLAATRRYADFALAERSPARGVDDAEDLAYWRRILDGAPPAVLPFAAADLVDAGAEPDSTVEMVTRDIDARLSGRLAALATRHEASVFLVLQCALHIVLGRWTGRRDVVVGTPVAVRPQRDFDRVLGCFVDILALRVDLSGDLAFTEVLARVGAAFHDAMEHRGVALDRMMEELTPRHRGTHPLFDVLFDYQVGEQAALRLTGMHATPIELPQPDTRFHLTLHARKHAGGIELRAVHRTAVLSGLQVDALLDQMVVLLAQSADPSAPQRSPFAARLPGRSR